MQFIKIDRSDLSERRRVVDMTTRKDLFFIYFLLLLFLYIFALFSAHTYICELDWGCKGSFLVWRSTTKEYIGQKTHTIVIKGPGLVAPTRTYTHTQYTCIHTHTLTPKHKQIHVITHTLIQRRGRRPLATIRPHAANSFI